MARPQFKRGLSINNTKPSSQRSDGPKMTDLVELYDWPKKGTGQIRATGPIQGRGVHKIKVQKKDGAQIEITKACLAYNPETDEFEQKPCPYCKMPEGYQRRQKRYFMNVIDRRLEEDKPAKVKKTAEETESGYKSMESNSWTPARVWGVPGSVAERLQDLSGKNILKSKSGSKKAFDFNHDKYGFDLDVAFNPKSKNPANIYSTDRNMDERFTPLDEDQLEYLLWNIDPVYEPETMEIAKAEAKGLTERWAKAIGDDRGGDDGDDDDEETERHPKKKKAAPAKKRRDEPEEEDEEEDEDGDELDLDSDEEEEEEDEAPARKKKPAPSKKKRPEPEDEDEEDEDEDAEEEGEEDDGFDEEEEEEPAPRKKKPAPAAKKAAPSKKRRPEPEPEDEDEDDEEEGEEEDDDFEEPAPKKKPAAGKKPAPGKKPVGKKKPAAEDDDLDDLDEDSDEPF
jgi:hypothetical protein